MWIVKGTFMGWEVLSGVLDSCGVADGKRSRFLRLIQAPIFKPFFHVFYDTPPNYGYRQGYIQNKFSYFLGKFFCRGRVRKHSLLHSSPGTKMRIWYRVS